MMALASAGCGKEMTGNVVLYERMTVLHLTEEQPHFATLLQFRVHFATTSIFDPPHEKIDVELELVKAELGGRPIPVSLGSHPSFAVDSTGTKATWSAMIENFPKLTDIEVPLAGDIVFDGGDSQCSTHLPVEIELRWKLNYRGSWKLGAPMTGTVRTEEARAYVNCGPRTAIVVGADGVSRSVSF